MARGTLYSIGHGTRQANELLALLLQYRIEYLVDVRSIPHSRYNPQYNQNILRAFLEGNGIRYVYMGGNLGGRPKDPLCYTNGKINYSIVSIKGFFIEGIERLKKAYDSEADVAIMCSESKPGNCHRCHLIGKALIAEGIALQHIDEHGALKSQIEVMGSIDKVQEGVLF